MLASIRIRTLGLFALLAAPLSAPAVEFKDLTQDMIRTRVKAYLALPTTVAKLSPLKPLFTVRDDAIIYTAAGGMPPRLEWRFQTGPEFRPDRFPQINATLRGILEDVLMRYNGGLLSERDARTLLSRTTFVATPGLIPAPAPPGMPRAGGVAPRPVPVGYGALYPAVALFPSYPNTWSPYPQTCYWWQYPWWSSPWWTYPYSSYSWYPPYPHYTPVLVAEAPAPKRAADIAADRSASSLYSEALSYYWGRDAESALLLLAAALQRDAHDARVWYFKALAERMKGDVVAAKESARRGAALEVLHRGDRSQLGVALERVQGADRQFLRSALTSDMTFEKAREIAALPVKHGPAMATAK